MGIIILHTSSLPSNMLCTFIMNIFFLNLKNNRLNFSMHTLDNFITTQVTSQFMFIREIIVQPFKKKKSDWNVLKRRFSKFSFAQNYLSNGLSLLCFVSFRINAVVSKHELEQNKTTANEKRFFLHRMHYYLLFQNTNDIHVYITQRK